MHGVFDRVRAFDSIAVSGEVSEWSERNNTVYFTLKDARAVLQCVAYSSRAQKFPNIGPGSAIIAQGRVRVAEWRSRYELLVESVRLTGIGELFRQYEELKERFRPARILRSRAQAADPGFSARRRTRFGAR